MSDFNKLKVNLKDRAVVFKHLLINVLTINTTKNLVQKEKCQMPIKKLIKQRSKTTARLLVLISNNYKILTKLT